MRALGIEIFSSIVIIIEKNFNECYNPLSCFKFRTVSLKPKVSRGKGWFHYFKKISNKKTI